MLEAGRSYFGKRFIDQACDAYPGQSRRAIRLSIRFCIAPLLWALYITHANLSFYPAARGWVFLLFGGSQGE
jgi:hypothetical protein